MAIFPGLFSPDRIQYLARFSPDRIQYLGSAFNPLNFRFSPGAGFPAQKPKFHFFSAHSGI
jgi:hypothetical protein